MTSALGVVLAVMLWRWFKLEPVRISAVALATIITAVVLPGHPTWPFLVAVLGLAWLTAGREGEAGEWFNQAWDYTKQIVPLLLGGVLVAGFLLGRPGHEGMIPSERRRQFHRIESVRGRVRRVHVLRHADRSPDRAGSRR